MPAQLTLYVDRRSPRAAITRATVAEVCRAADPPITLAIVNAQEDPQGSDRQGIIALPALTVTDDPSRRAIGEFTSVAKVRDALDRITMSADPSEVRARFHPRVLGDLASLEGSAVLVLAEDGEISFATVAAAHLFGRPLEALIGLPFGLPAADAEERTLTLRLPFGDERVVSARTMRGMIGDSIMTIVIFYDRTEASILEQQLANTGMVDRGTGLITETALVAAAAERPDGGAGGTVVAFDVHAEGLPPLAVERAMVALAEGLDDAAGVDTLLARTGPSRIAALLPGGEDEAFLTMGAMRCLDDHDARVGVGSAPITTSIRDALEQATQRAMITERSRASS